jgi:cell division protein FtsA
MEQDTGFDLSIDIGSSAVRVVMTRPIKKNGENTTLEIVGLGKAPCEGVKKGGITNLNKTAQAIEMALQAAFTKSGYLLSEMPANLFANVNVSGKNIKTKTDFSTITRKTAGDGVKNEDICQLFEDVHKTLVPDGTKIIHVLPIDFTVDGNDHIEESPIGDIGRKLGGEFQIITGNISDLEYIKKTLKMANPCLTRSEFVVSPLAAALSVLDEKQKTMGVALVDIGGGTTDVAIFHNGITRHVAILPFAGNHITLDIKEGCSLDNESAESAKFAVTNSDPSSFLDNILLVVPTTDGIPPIEVLAKNVAKIMQARLREIAAMVYAEIKRAGYDGKLRAGIVLTGGSSKIKNIEKTFTQITGIPTQVGKLKGIEKINVNEQIVSDSSWATALGLAWLDVKKLDIRIPDNNWGDNSSDDIYNKGSETTLPIKPPSWDWRAFKDKINGFVGDKLEEYPNQ